MSADDILVRVPPHSLDAEQSVLGAVLLDNDAIKSARKIVVGADFYRQSHRHIFAAMIELSEHGRPIDAITLTDALDNKGALEAIGGPAYVAELAAVVPTAINIEHYAGIVREKSHRRALASIGIDIVDNAYDVPDIRVLMRSTLDRLEHLAQPVSADSWSGPWAKARQVDEFLIVNESAQQYLIEPVLARESVTVIASPRGQGKTHLAYWFGIDLAHRGFRGLIIDRDNPKGEIRRRLKAWGGAGLADKLKIVARDEAPPLTDKAAWAEFPYADYDFVILDSISAATEGVEEKDGGKAGAGLAPLLDAARRGPAVLLLANTTKDGMKVRGSGTLSDRADIVFEVRDATDLQVNAKHQVWWEALPDGAEHAWSDRAKRRRRRESYRLALVVSKFRLGEEPSPVVYEIHHDTDPWSVSDVTREVEHHLEDAKRAAADAQQAKIDAAVKALVAALPIAKNPDAAKNANAVDFVMKLDFGRNGARRLIEDRMGRDWTVSGDGTKKDPHILRAAGNPVLDKLSPPAVPSTPIPAVIGGEGQQESMLKSDSAAIDLDSPNSCQSISNEEGELC